MRTLVFTDHQIMRMLMFTEHSLKDILLIKEWGDREPVFWVTPGPGQTQPHTGLHHSMHGWEAKVMTSTYRHQGGCFPHLNLGFVRIKKPKNFSLP